MVVDGDGMEKSSRLQGLHSDRGLHVWLSLVILGASRDGLYTILY
jgi:hypothetical protein